jgi:hypothetical protein
MGYLFGDVSAVRTNVGRLPVDTGSRGTACQTFPALLLRLWPNVAMQPSVVLVLVLQQFEWCKLPAALVLTS